MKDIIKNGVSIFFKLIVIVIMSGIFMMSITVLSTAAFTENIGYDAVVTDDSGKIIDQYEYRTEQGKDKKIDSYEEKGYKVTKNGVRSDMTKTGVVVDYSVSILFSIIMIIAFCYNHLFIYGNKDFNLVKCGHVKEDKLKGLKIGLVASVPNFLFYIFCVVLSVVKPKTSIALYKLPNFQYFKLLNLIMGKAQTLGEVSVISYVLTFLTLLIVPAICFGSYYLGYKDINIAEKLTYKKGNGK